MATLEMMKCEPLRMTLSRPGCARLWEAAQARKPDPWDAKAACRHCLVGALNAGKPVSVPIAAARSMAEQLAQVCPRCRRPALRIVKGGLCVSCYNRHREVVIGANRKGTRPRLADVLHPESVAVAALDDVGSHRVVRHELASGPLEVMIAEARRATSPMAFCRPAVPVDV